MIITIKYIPVICGISYAVNSILSVNEIYLRVISYISGMDFLPLIFIYISSFVLKFCIYHRIHLYYIFVCNVINMLHFEGIIPEVLPKGFIYSLIIIYIILFIITYIHVKTTKKITATNNR